MRRHRPNDPKTDELAAEFKADRLAQHIRRVVDSAPPLSQAQKDRLAVLLQVPRCPRERPRPDNRRGSGPDRG